MHRGGQTSREMGRRPRLRREGREIRAEVHFLLKIERLPLKESLNTWNSFVINTWNSFVIDKTIYFIINPNLFCLEKPYFHTFSDFPILFGISSRDLGAAAMPYGHVSLYRTRCASDV